MSTFITVALLVVGVLAFGGIVAYLADYDYTPVAKCNSEDYEIADKVASRKAN